MTAPANPIPLVNTAQYLTPTQLAMLENFNALPYAVQGRDTQIVHLAPNGNVTHLHGTGMGQEGVALYQQLQGEQHLPFDQVLSESAFQWGATIERTIYPKRVLNLRVAIFGRTAYQYALCDNRWWDGQDETRDGWIGIRSRYTGWRWIPVRPMKTVDTPQRSDPIAYGNFFAIWDVNLVCQRPWYSRPALHATWTAAGSPQKNGQYYGSVTLANQADMPTYVQYLIGGSGNKVAVQDNNTTTMVALPPVFDSDGPCLVDTDPQNRTLVASADPVDTLFYKYLQSSTVLSFLLSNIAVQGEPWWRRGYTRFVGSVPPRTSVTFNVAHDNPAGTITAILTQRFKRSR